MGYVFTNEDALRYEQWLQKPRIRSILEMEDRMMMRMLEPHRRSAALDIGCGTGRGLAAFIEKGMYATGVDPSPDMIEIAKKNIGPDSDIHLGFAEELPFDDNAFEYSSLVHALEFVNDPVNALEEMFRVTKDRAFIGILNRFSGRAFRLRTERIFFQTLYSRARFYTPWEVFSIIRSLLGDVPIAWGTLIHFPNPVSKLPGQNRRIGLAFKSPIGSFTGFTVYINPKYRTRPLELKRCPEPTPEALTGCSAIQRRQ